MNTNFLKENSLHEKIHINWASVTSKIMGLKQLLCILPIACFEIKQILYFKGVPSLHFV